MVYVDKPLKFDTLAKCGGGGHLIGTRIRHLCGVGLENFDASKRGPDRFSTQQSCT